MGTQTPITAQGTAQDALDFAAERARRYVRTVGERRVGPGPGDLAGLAKFHEKLPETGSAAPEVVRMLDELGAPATVASTGGRYFGYVTGGALPASMAASWLASAWDQNAALRAMSPV